MVVNIKDALDGCADLVADVRHRNKTLIDYYIDRNTVPTAIAAYDPRLVILQNRVRCIKKINFSHLERLIDDPDCLAASHLNSIVTELLNAIIGYKGLFEQHYDPSLCQRAPYAVTYGALEVLQHRLHELIRTRQSDPGRPRAEHLLSQRNSNDSSRYQFCRGAVQVLNDNDGGRIANVSTKELLSSNRDVLAEKGGAYLWWRCPVDSCAFKLRFHVVYSQTSSIHNNSEIRSHPSVPLKYRSVFLIKSHLHIASDRAETPKYGCLFCFAQGMPLKSGQTAFSNGRELAVHVCGAHKGSKLPPAILLEKFRVAVNEEVPVMTRRWDANFLTS